MLPQEPIILRGIGTDAVNSFEDLSGSSKNPPITLKGSSNPYDALIAVGSNDPGRIQKAYQTHRTTRNANQRARLLSEDFQGITVDPILQELEHTRGRPTPLPPAHPRRTEDVIDPRNCLVFWARPPQHVMDLIQLIQTRLREFAPALWIMPRECLHMTVLEITHSTTEPYVAMLVDKMGKSCLENIVNHPRNNRARLVKPLLSFDAAALAVSFLPACGKQGDAYTYHHLRRDVYAMSKEAGVGVTSRYVVPSAHVTIARFVTAEDHELEGGEVDREKMKGWMELVWRINEEIAEWDGEWVIGEERGVDCRRGRLWYGGGETVVQAEGFQK